MNDRNLADLAGAWVCREAELRLLASGHMAAQEVSGRTVAPPSNNGRVAVVPIVGVLSKSPAWWSSGMAYGEISQRVRMAAASPDVGSILLYVDSPGGTVAGCDDVAADIAAAAQQKSVIAFASDQCNSGAYYLASQATKIYANRSALVGSIGVYTVIVDTSKMAERAGLTVHVIKAGDFKAGAIPGVAISADALKEQQRLIDGMYDRFVGVVASGRKISRKRAGELADGRVHTAADAVKLGLIDGVSSLNVVFAQLQTGQLPGTSPAAAGNQVKGKPKMDAKAEFDEAVATYMERNPNKSKAEAARDVLVADPELRERYVAEHNEQFQTAVQGRRR